MLALSVDALDDPSGAYALMDGLGWPFLWGFVDQATLERLETLQHAMFDRAVPLSVPFAWLLDAENKLVAIYRGEMNVSSILAEASSLIDANDETRHHLDLRNAFQRMRCLTCTWPMKNRAGIRSCGCKRNSV